MKVKKSRLNESSCEGKEAIGNQTAKNIKKTNAIKNVSESDEQIETKKRKTSCMDDKHTKLSKKNRRRTYNKEAIEKMKARQMVKKEKVMRQVPAPPPKPEAKHRRPKLPVRLEHVELNFTEDDDSMAQFEGVWVPREETGRLQSAREELEKRGLPAEKVNRRMKQLVRREHRKLKLGLIAAQTKTERVARERRQFMEAQQTKRVRRRVPGRACGLILQEGEQLARFDGFWVSAEAVPRLEALRQQFTDSGKTEDEARRLLRKARRSEERKVKSCGRLVCTRCGGRGHMMTECTAQAVESAAAGTVCFRCGLAGHRLFDCPKKGETAGLPFATCFLCKQRGHMSRECPKAEGDDAARRSRGTEQKPGKARPGKAKEGGGQSWRGIRHDAGETAAKSTVNKTHLGSAPVTQQKLGVHIRFD